ncbi:hypothetical protein DPMN_002030, partial [Dreissena polymorpha]
MFTISAKDVKDDPTRHSVDFNMYDLLMLPQCKGNNHWVLLVASVMSRTVTIYDWLGGNNKALFDLFCQVMCQRAQIVKDGLEKIQFRVQSPTLQQTAPWKQLSHFVVLSVGLW